MTIQPTTRRQTVQARFADGRVYSRDELAKMANDAGLATVQFHNLTQLPGNSLMIAGRG